MTPDPITRKSGFWVSLAAVAWNALAAAADLAVIVSILGGALAVGVVFIFREWARPSISTEKVQRLLQSQGERIRDLERALEGQR